MGSGRWSAWLASVLSIDGDTGPQGVCADVLRTLGAPLAIVVVVFGGLALFAWHVLQALRRP